MNTPTQERRHFSRVVFDAQTSISQNGESWPVELIDLSLKGALIQQPENFDIDRSAALTLDIHLTEDSSIIMQVQWRHSEHGQVGLVCRSIDIDSISHLRRLVELNLGDADLLERELDALQS